MYIFIFLVLLIEKGQKQVHPRGVYLVPRSCPLPLPKKKKGNKRGKKKTQIITKPHKILFFGETADSRCGEGEYKMNLG